MTDPDLRHLLNHNPDDNDANRRAASIVRRAQGETGARDVGKLLGIRGWMGIFLILIGLLELVTGTRNRETDTTPPEGSEDS